MKNSVQTLKKFYNVAGYDKLYIRLLIFSFLITGFTLLYTRGMSMAVEGIRLSGDIFFFGVTMLVLGKGLSYTFTYLYEKTIVVLKARLIVKFQEFSLEKLQSSAYLWLIRTSSANINSRMDADIESVAMVVADFIPNLIKRIVVSVLLSVVMFCINLPLGCICLATTLLMLYFQNWGNKKCDKYYTKLRDAENLREVAIGDQIKNFSLIKLYQLDERMKKLLSDLNDRYTNTFAKTMGAIIIMFCPSSILTSLTPVLVCGVGYFLMQKGAIAFDQYMTAFVLSISITDELKGLTTIFSNLPNLVSYGARVFEIWDAPQEQDNTLTQPQSKALPSSPFINAEGISIVIDEKTVVKQLSFCADKGQIILLCGSSGSGKSTVAKALVGLFPYQGGSLCIDGQEIKEMDLHELRKTIGYISQTQLLPDISIEEFLREQSDLADQTLCEYINKKIGFDKFVKELELGYQTTLRQLSGGERQFVSLYSLLTQDKPILILDESTSALDNQRTGAIKDCLTYLSKTKGRTIINISHRGSDSDFADKIVEIKVNR